MSLTVPIIWTHFSVVRKDSILKTVIRRTLYAQGRNSETSYIKIGIQTPDVINDVSATRIFEQELHGGGVSGKEVCLRYTFG